MTGRSSIVTRFIVAMLCFWLAGHRIEEKCTAGSGDCLVRLAWDDWLLILAGAGLLSATLLGLARQARSAGDREAPS